MQAEHTPPSPDGEAGPEGGATLRAISGESILRGQHGEGSAGSSAALSESGCDPTLTQVIVSDLLVCFNCTVVLGSAM